MEEEGGREGRRAYLDVFQRDHPSSAAVLVDDDSHMHSALAHFLEAGPDRHRLGDEVGGLHDLFVDGGREGGMDETSG